MSKSMEVSAPGDVTLFRWRDPATGDVEEIDFPEWSRRENKRLSERGRRRGAGEVLEGSETTQPDGTVVRKERVTTLEQLRAEYREQRRPAARSSVATATVVRTVSRPGPRGRERRRSSSTTATRTTRRSSSSGDSDSEPEPPGGQIVCPGVCGGILFTPSTPRQQYHSLDCNNAARQARLRRARAAEPVYDELMLESERMGIVERVAGVWRLTAYAERVFGSALRGLPDVTRDDVRAAA